MDTLDKNGSYSSHDKERSNPNKRISAYYLNIIFLCIMALVSLSLCVLLFIRIQRLEKVISRQQGADMSSFNANDRLYTQTEYDRAVMQARAAERRAILLQVQASLESGNTTVTMLRELFPETVVVMHEGRYYFYPLQGSLGLNQIRRGSFGIGESGAMTYLGDRRDVSLTHGIAVSELTGEIEWEKVEEDQIGFAMLHAGGLVREEDESEEGSEEAYFVQDERVEQYLTGIAQSEIRPGLYVDLNAASPEEAVTEAERAVSLFEEAGLQEGVIAASIVVPDSGDPLSVMSRTEWSDCAEAFCSAVREAGYTPVLCGNLASFHMLLELSRFEDCSKWITGMTDPAYYPYAYRYWEYSEAGTVSGIENSVRLLIQVQIQGQ